MYCSVNGFVCLVCCVFVNCFMKQFKIFLCVVVNLLLNVIEVLNVSEGALLDRPCIFSQIMCVVCL